MSLSPWEQRALASIQDGLSSSARLHLQQAAFLAWAATAGGA